MKPVRENISFTESFAFFTTMEPPFEFAVFCPRSRALSPAEETYSTSAKSTTRSLPFWNAENIAS